MVVFLSSCVAILVVALLFVLLCMSNTESRLSEMTAERDELFHRTQQAEFENSKLRAELKCRCNSFDNFRQQVEDLSRIIRGDQ